MLELAKKIGISEAFVSEISFLDENEICSLADKCLQKGFHCLAKKKNQVRIAVILECAKRAKVFYEEKGIPEGVYYDTFNDIKIWADKCENGKSFNYGWLSNHCRCELFRLGRLQFQIYPCRNKTLLYKKLPFSFGEKLIYVHIPEGERLCLDKCKESLSRSKDFFKAFFPEYEYRYYFCESWLLFEGNGEFMKKDSNILSFASLFTHAYSVKIDAQATERIFGKRRLFIKSYPEKTSLQKSAKAYMKSGKKMGVGIGYIDKNSI